MFKTGFFWAKGIQPDINIPYSENEGKEANGIQYFYEQNFEDK